MSVDKQFADRLAARFGISNEDGWFTDFLNRWARWEGSKASYNPLATTQPMEGATNFNSVGVKNFTSLQQGVDATYKTLTNGFYPSIVQAIQNKDLSAVNPDEVRTWGTTGWANELEGGSTGGGTISSNITVPDLGGDVASASLYGDPQLDQMYQNLQKASLDAFDAWERAGGPAQGPQAERWYAAQDSFLSFIQTYGEPQQNAITPEERAQVDFENQITLGDFGLREADQAFRHWRDKNEKAQAAANDKLAEIDAHNASIIERTEARNASTTPGLHHRAVDRAMLRPSYNDVLEEFEGRYGAGGPAPAGAAGVSVGQPGPSADDVAAQRERELQERARATAEAGAGPSRREPIVTDVYPSMPYPGASAEPGAPSYRYPSQPYPGASAGLDPQDPLRTPSEPKSWWETIGGRTNERGEPTLFGDSLPQIGRNLRSGPAGKVGGTVKKWWQRGFAEGGTNIKGGPAWVGERGPEIMEVPGFGARMVGTDGPEQMNVPEGANIMPLDEAFTFDQIQKAAQQPGRPNQQRALSKAERANDPQLQQKVIEALTKATASHFAANPPMTPTLTDPRVKDRWAMWRPLTGVPAMPEPEQPAKGARR